MGKRFHETFLTKVKEFKIKPRKNHTIDQMNKEVRISIFIIQLIKLSVNYKKPDIVSKSHTIEDWKVKDKIIREIMNSVKAKIISLQPRHHLLQKYSIWSISKDVIK